jgi:hypothetical protein
MTIVLTKQGTGIITKEKEANIGKIMIGSIVRGKRGLAIGDTMIIAKNQAPPWMTEMIGSNTINIGGIVEKFIRIVNKEDIEGTIKDNIKERVNIIIMTKEKGAGIKAVKTASQAALMKRKSIKSNQIIKAETKEKLVIRRRTRRRNSSDRRSRQLRRQIKWIKWRRSCPR